MRAWLPALALFLATSALAQQQIQVATPPAGDNSNAAASTAFVANAFSYPSSNTQLSALPSTYAASVTRVGFATAGDSPEVVFTPSGSACSLNAGAGDGGSQVPTSDGKCWIANLKNMIAVPEIWGAPHNGSANDATAFNAMFASAATDPASQYGLVCNGTSYVLSSAVTVSNALHFSACGTSGAGNISVSGAITAVSITAAGVTFENTQLLGTRTSGQVGLSVSGSQDIINEVSVQLMDTCILQPVGSGFKTTYQNIQTRNCVSYVGRFEDGVGPVIRGWFYDTDGPWYTGGTYAVPTQGGLVFNTEGALVEDYDIIHGNGIWIVANASLHAFGPSWLKFGKGYIDSSVGDGLTISNQTSGAILIRGIEFDGLWSATNQIGFHTITDGTSQIDTVICNGCEIHNNTYDGVQLNGNTYRVSFSNPMIGGNNAPWPSGWPGSKTAGTWNNMSFYQGSSVAVGLVNITGGMVGRLFGWSTTPSYNLSESCSGCSIFINGTYLDSGGVLTANLNDPNGDFQFADPINVPVTAAHSQQAQGNTFTLAQGATSSFPTGSNMMLLNEPNAGDLAMFLLGGNNVALVSHTQSTFVASASPAAGKIGVFYSSGSYQITNNYGSSVTITSYDVRLRGPN